MKSVYRILAYVIAAEVIIQASMIAFALFGLGKWVEDGGVLNKSALDDSNLSFTGAAGFAIHGMNGMMVIPFLALVLLIVSFFAKVPGGVRWAAGILGLVVIQVMLGMFGHGIVVLGPFHAINAFILLTVAIMAARRVEITKAASAGQAPSGQQVTA